MTTTDDVTGRPTSQTLPPSPAVQELMAAAAAVAALDPVELSGAQALADAAALLAVLDQLRVHSMHRLADVQARDLHTLDGAGTTVAWLRSQQASTDPRDLPLARKLSRLPLLRRQLDDGALPIRTATVLAGELDRLRRHVDRLDALIDGRPAELTVAAVVVDGVLGQICTCLGGLDDADPRLDQLRAELADIASRPQSELLRLEAAFLVLARHVPADQLRGALDPLVDALLPQQLEDRCADAHARRGFTVTRNPDGSGYFISDGECDVELGELLSVVIDAEMSVDPDNPTDTAGWAAARADGWEPGDIHPGEQPPAILQREQGSDELESPQWQPGRRPRTLKQRRHDALKNGLRKLLDSGALGLRDKVAPHLGATVSIDQLHNAAGSLPAISTATGNPLPLSLVRSWWCDSSVSRFVLSLGRKVLETSHTERTLKGHERRAKQVETGGRCQAVGHVHPGPIPHHVDPWASSGQTSYRDTVMVCASTHHDLHTGKRIIRLKDGRWLNEHGWTDGPDG